MREVIIPCDDGPIVLQVNDDGVTTYRANFKKLDDDLRLIDEGYLGVVGDDYFSTDTYDYDNHPWETPKGKMIGELFALVDAGVEV